MKIYIMLGSKLCISSGKACGNKFNLLFLCLSKEQYSTKISKKQFYT